MEQNLNFGFLKCLGDNNVFQKSDNLIVKRRDKNLDFKFLWLNNLNELSDNFSSR